MDQIAHIRGMSRIGTVALVVMGLFGCVSPSQPREPSPRHTEVGDTSSEPAPSARNQDVIDPARTTSTPTVGTSDFEVWDMHASGMEPLSSAKIIDPTLAQRGYWLSSAFLGMPRAREGARIGAGVVLESANLSDRQRVLRERLASSGIAGTQAMVMLDAEAFEPYDSAKSLEWYNQTARMASTQLRQWFWYFQPGRVEAAVPSRFPDEDAYFDWYASQEFMQRATAISVTLYHGRERDMSSETSASARAKNDRHLRRAIEFAERMGKPLIVVVRADMSGRPREQIMTTKALEASWRELILREGVDGIAIWNDQPLDKIDFDRDWSQKRIEPTLRKLLNERAQQSKAPIGSGG